MRGNLPIQSGYIDFLGLCDGLFGLYINWELCLQCHQKVRLIWSRIPLGVGLIMFIIYGQNFNTQPDALQFSLLRIASLFSADYLQIICCCFIKSRSPATVRFTAERWWELASLSLSFWSSVRKGVLSPLTNGNELVPQLYFNYFQVLLIKSETLIGTCEWQIGTVQDSHCYRWCTCVLWWTELNQIARC